MKGWKKERKKQRHEELDKERSRNIGLYIQSAFEGSIELGALE
jgi:hypothetical protein